MIIKKNASTIAIGGALLSLALVAAPLQAQDTAASDPTVDNAANGTEMTAEELEMAAEKAEMEAEEMGDEMAEGMDKAGEEVEEAADGAAAVVADAIDDDEIAERISQQIGTEPSLGSYALDVTEIDGRYSVNGMIDKSEDYDLLRGLLADIEGVDPSMIDNNVVQN